ncbi:MAG TPA: Crp/Fnr family transcriptional regulator [Bradyrhizobium sp.]|nr:Crp/Fnr family transcriptional regulator [Bradyrhizobium sp.]
MNEPTLTGSDQETSRSSLAAEVNNRLLRMLPARELSGLLAVSEKVRIRPRQVLHHYKLPMEYVYFVEQGLVSVAAKVGQEKFVEVWLIGSEGLVGAPVILNTNAHPLHRRTVQVEGSALRIAIPEFRRLLKEFPVVRAVLDAYLAVVLVQTSQSGACNSVHQLKQRLARWLLLAHNALGSDDIPLTHEVLAQLLGVRRASVTEGLEVLQSEGLVVTRRGSIRIEKMAELESVCCECFGLIDREYERQLDPIALRRALASAQS